MGGGGGGWHKASVSDCLSLLDACLCLSFFFVAFVLLLCFDYFVWLAIWLIFSVSCCLLLLCVSTSGFCIVCFAFVLFFLLFIVCCFSVVCLTVCWGGGGGSTAVAGVDNQMVAQHAQTIKSSCHFLWGLGWLLLFPGGFVVIGGFWMVAVIVLVGAGTRGTCIPRVLTKLRLRKTALDPNIPDPNIPDPEVPDPNIL